VGWAELLPFPAADGFGQLLPGHNRRFGTGAGGDCHRPLCPPPPRGASPGAGHHRGLGIASGAPVPVAPPVTTADGNGASKEGSTAGKKGGEGGEEAASGAGGIGEQGRGTRGEERSRGSDGSAREQRSEGGKAKGCRGSKEERTR
jgi:hypothetical protein